MNGEGSKSPASKVDVGRLAEILIEIQKGFKALDYYKEGHPVLYQSINNCFHAIDERLKGMDSISISVKRRGFFSGFHQIGKEIAILSSLSNELYVRGLRKIFILKGFTLHDFDIFLRAVHLSPKELREKGGIEAALSEKSIKTIWLNEVNYDKLIAKDLSYKGETEDVATEKLSDELLSATSVSTLAVEEKEREVPPEELKNKVADEKKGLKELIEEIQGPIDDKRYSQILELITHLSGVEVAGGRFELPVDILKVLSDHVDNAAKASADRERMALEGIRAITLYPLLNFLIAKLCDPKEGKWPLTIILKFGEGAIDPLLDSLTEAENLHARRLLAEVIEKFGEKAAHKARDHLNDKRWFVVRNMVTILGDIGGQDDVATIARLLNHGDIRVSKEAVKAITHLGGKEAANRLTRYFSRTTGELKQLIVFSLGVLEEDVAIPLLKNVIQSKGIIDTEHDLRKEAIMAIGKLGREEAISTLSELLTIEQLFKKEREDIRIASAKSLASIGGKDALEALKKGSKASNKEVRETCEKLLSRVKKG